MRTKYNVLVINGVSKVARNINFHLIIHVLKLRIFRSFPVRLRFSIQKENFRKIMLNVTAHA